MDNDTIVAQTTPSGKSSVGIVRVSGMQAKKVALKILGSIPKERFATYSKFTDLNKTVLDYGISLWFPKPRSFTGEDILELHSHGNPVIIDLLIKTIISIDHVRIARPGEFSERAFLNGKLDLVQAEAIDDLINSENELSIRASLNSLQGYFSKHLKQLEKILILFRTQIESSIDFVEDVDIDVQDVIIEKFNALNNQFIKIKKIIKKESIFREAKKIVIAGPPNAGKSSLLNNLLHQKRSIVTDIPGTTRDVIYENVNINGILCQLVDTAGLRDTSDTIEKIGIQLAWKEIKECHHVLFVIDKTMEKKEQEKYYTEFLLNIPKNIQITLVFNKNDLNHDSWEEKKLKNTSFFNISAKTGEGIDALCNRIVYCSKNLTKDNIFIARRRHIYQIDLIYHEFIQAKKTWKKYKNIEFLAESLKMMNTYIGEITGKFTSDDLLKNIFSNFCIGK